MRVRTLGLAGALALMVAAPVRSQAPASQAWVHVRVEERSRQSKVSVNLPVSVVNAALQAAPEKFMSNGHIHLGRMGKNDLSVSDLRKAWNELKATGDAEFVTVEDEDETVRVSRAPATSCWSTSTSPAASESVRVEVPIEVVDALFSGPGEELNLRAGIRRAAEAPRRHRARQRWRLHRPHLDRRREIAMLKMVLIGAVAVPAIAAGSVAATGVVVVDVKEARGGHHIVVPVPLALAQVAAAFVPLDKTRVHLPREAEQYMPVARQVLEALASAEDGELVRVEEPGQKVSIRKEGGLLQHPGGRRRRAREGAGADLARAVRAPGVGWPVLGVAGRVGAAARALDRDRERAGQGRRAGVSDGVLIQDGRVGRAARRVFVSPVLQMSPAAAVARALDEPGSAA